MGLFEILVKRELTLECLQLPSINPLLNNACMPTLKSKLNEVLKISCIRNNIDISKMGPILPRLPYVRSLDEGGERKINDLCCDIVYSLVKAETYYCPLRLKSSYIC